MYETQYSLILVYYLRKAQLNTLFVCLFVRWSVTLIQIQANLLSLLAYFILLQFSRIV